MEELPLQVVLKNCYEGELTMKQNLITDIVQGMLPYLNNAQSKQLQEVLQHALMNYKVSQDIETVKESEQDFVELFYQQSVLKVVQRNLLSITNRPLLQC